jgi:predicted signal transduction protein with EAL and GGDEF domain
MAWRQALAGLVKHHARQQAGVACARTRCPLDAVCGQHGLDIVPQRLITESVLLEESKINLATLHKLHALGVSISIDDFGTGYSSLSYPRAFHFDKIKIDRSFVSDLGEGRDCMKIVRAIAQLGLSLCVPTTAEGVETDMQLEWLRQAGCTEMQGYLFSRPIPQSEIAGFLRSYQKSHRNDKTWLSKFEEGDKWSFSLTAAKTAADQET